MNDMTFIGDRQQTMSSLEIAKLSGKNHGDVMRDIRRMLDQLEVSQSRFASAYKDAQGKTRECYKLDRYHTEVLVTGYDVKRRAAVIKRWYELETGSVQPAVSMSVSQKDMIEGAGAFLDALRIEGSSRITSMRSFAASNCPQYLPLIPNYAIDAPSTSGSGSSEVTHSASHLLKDHGVNMSAAAFNKTCHAQGLLERQSRTNSKGKEVEFWSITHSGLEYGKNVTSPQSPLQTQPHWYDAKFDDLITLLGIQQQAA